MLNFKNPSFKYAMFCMCVAELWKEACKTFLHFWKFGVLSKFSLKKCNFLNNYEDWTYKEYAGQIVNKWQMRKLPGGWANGANCQEGANQATCQGGKVGKNLHGEALPLFPLAKVLPWMQPALLKTFIPSLVSLVELSLLGSLSQTCILN